jgi:hypothetical protein
MAKENGKETGKQITLPTNMRATHVEREVRLRHGQDGYGQWFRHSSQSV